MISQPLEFVNLWQSVQYHYQDKTRTQILKDPSNFCVVSVQTHGARGDQCRHRSIHVNAQMITPKNSYMRLSVFFCIVSRLSVLPLSHILGLLGCCHHNTIQQVTVWLSSAVFETYLLISTALPVFVNSTMCFRHSILVVSVAKNIILTLIYCSLIISCGRRSKQWRVGISVSFHCCL